MMMGWEVRNVEARSALWQQFVDLSYEYLSETWPERVSGISETGFKAKYEEMLLKRIQEGGRGLFLYYQDHQTVGLSNVYIDRVKNEKILHIAEFYVVPAFRRQGMATRMKDHVVKWGQQHSATLLNIEVDKSLDSSNRFWSSFGFGLDSSGQRNIYYCRLV
jgi:GNAT superfamily N-acetyltransferase